MDVSSVLDDLNSAQREAVAAPPGNILVLAGAGSGKTRVLAHRVAWYIQTGQATPYGIIAVTFTNKAAAEMRGRIEQLLQQPVGGMWVGTFHGLAHRLLRAHWQEAGLPQSFQIMDSEDQYRTIRRVLRAMQLDEAQFPPREVQGFINARKDDGLRPRHLEDQGDHTLHQMIRIYHNYQETCERAGLVDFAELLLRAHELFRDQPSILAHYRQRFRHVLVDEFQDTNALQYAWLRLLVGDTGTIFAVGDDDQCLAAGTQVTMGDGSRKAIEDIKAGELVMSGYGAGDFRPARVMERFIRQRKGRMLHLHMRSGKTLISTPEHTHFAGYVLGETPQTFFLYLMYKVGFGYRLGTSQVYTRGQKKPVVGFKQRALHERADALWIIRTHPNENEARADEMLTSLRYGLPTLPFVPRKGKAKNGLVHDRKYLMQVYQSLDTATAALRLLEDVGLDPERPHHLPQSRNSNRRNIVITLCGDRRGANPMHRISIIGVDAAGKRELQSLGLNVRPARTGSKSWRFEIMRREFGELMAIAHKIRQKLEGRYVLQGHILNRSLPFTTAAGIRSGMVMATEDGVFDIVERIESRDMELEVFDLNIDRTHNFVANGVITHNSIYSWRGARVENMQRFSKDFADTRLLRLEQNYRSTANILNAANMLIARNNSRLGKELWTEGDSGEQINLYTAFNEQDEARFVVDQIASWYSRHRRYSDCAVLYRVSAQSRVLEEALMHANVPYRVYGGMRFYERAEIKDALAYLRLATFQDDDASFERIINTPPRGVGERTIEEIRTAAKRDQCSLWVAAGQLVQHKLLSARALNSVEAFLQLIRKIHDSGQGLPLDELLDAVIKQSGLVEHYKKEKGERGLARVENLEELVTAAGEFEMADDEQEALTPLHAFLAHAALEAGETQAGAWTDCVHLMTLHSAKGLEFRNVFIVGMEEGLFPHQRSSAEPRELEEERRLCYVGITRAQEVLTLTHALHRRLHGNDFYPQPSRFIQELPPASINTVRLGSDAIPRSLFIVQANAEDTAGFALGQRVTHAKFGEGVILNLEGSGPNTRIQVNFEQAGSKWLVAAYANLK